MSLHMHIALTAPLATVSPAVHTTYYFYKDI
jgi:hypothetical protein